MCGMRNEMEGNFIKPLHCMYKEYTQQEGGDVIDLVVPLWHFHNSHFFSSLTTLFVSQLSTYCYKHNAM